MTSRARGSTPVPRTSHSTDMSRELEIESSVLMRTPLPVRSQVAIVA
jgi:hypothetical protein